jgi:peptidylprolyl isomerase
VKAALYATLLCLALAGGFGCGEDDESQALQKGEAGDANGPAPSVPIPKGPAPDSLVVKDLKEGSGAGAVPGDDLVVYFTAFRYTTGDHFETIWKPDKPFDFRLDRTEVIPGWVKGLVDMKAGGRRYLIVPGPLAARGGLPPSQSPEDNTLVYLIDLLRINGSRGDEKSNAGDPADAIRRATPAEAAERTRPAVPVPPGPPPKALVVEDLIEGTGRPAKDGDVLTVEYVSVHYFNGRQWSGSWEPDKPPFTFELGAKTVLPGWEKGLVGMKAGGRRKLVIPSDLVYPAGSAPPGVGPEGTLVYEVDLLAVR